MPGSFKVFKNESRRYRPQMILGPTCKMFEAVVELYIPIQMAHLIDEGIARGDKGMIWSMGGRMLLLVLAGLFFTLICQYMASVASQGFGTAVRDRLYAKIMALSSEQIERFGAGSLTNRLTVDVNQMQLAVAMMIRLLFRAPFLCIGGFFMAFTIDPLLSVILLAAIPVAALLLWLVMRATIRIYQVAQAKLDKLSQLIQDNLAGVRVIRAFDRGRRERELFSDKNLQWQAVVMRAGKIAGMVNPFSTLIFNLAIVGVLYLGGLKIQAGGLTQGDLIALINYLNQIVAAMIVVANLVLIFTKAFASSDRVAEVIAVETPSEAERAESGRSAGPKSAEAASAGPESAEAERTTDGQSAEALSPDWRIDLCDVGYSYPGAGAPALEGVSFSIHKGSRLGVIGGTGSGKTTLAHVIAGIYPPTRGSIEYEAGKPVDGSAQGLDGDQKPPSKPSIQLIFQKPVIFSGTIRSNLRLAAPNASDDELFAALRVAQAADFVQAHPDGLDREVERGGVNFSGGQRQRIAIARALLAQPDILIMDDCSSALDYATDAALYRDLLKWAGDRVALIIISQRVYSVARAKGILVLNNGRPVGLGSHEEIYRSCPLYHEICLSQQEADDPDPVDGWTRERRAER